MFLGQAKTRANLRCPRIEKGKVEFKVTSHIFAYLFDKLIFA